MITMMWRSFRIKYEQMQAPYQAMFSQILIDSISMEHHEEVVTHNAQYGFIRAGWGHSPLRFTFALPRLTLTLLGETYATLAAFGETIGANHPETPGTVPDLERLSRVPPGNGNLPRLSRNSMNP